MSTRFLISFESTRFPSNKMKSVTLSKEISTFPSLSFKEVYAACQKHCWERHNAARNAAHADYSNPNYIRNRLAADAAWAKDSDEIVDVCQKLLGYMPPKQD